MPAHAWLFLAAVLVLPSAAVLAATPLGPKIAVDDVADWQVEVYLGAAGLDGFVPGPRRGGGGPTRPGPVVFDPFGNAFVAADTYVYAVIDDSRVVLLAGLPGGPGEADGPADRACFRSIRCMIATPAGELIVGDAGGHTIRKLARDAAGRWRVTTLAGVAGQGGHRDGPAGQALFDRPDGLALDSRGTLYVMDRNWLRTVRDGQVTTLNPKGGAGFANGPLESARFNQDQGGGSHVLAMGPDDQLTVADRWNVVFRQVDLKRGVVSTLAGGKARLEPGFEKGPAHVDGPAMDARFHPGGGPCGIWYDPASGRLYTITADETAVRAIEAGQVTTLGPWLGNKPGVLEGPIRDAGGHHVGLHGVDPQGRLYITDPSHPGFVRRLFRKTPYPNAAKPERPNPLAAAAPATGRLKQAGGELRVPAPPAGDGALASGQPAVLDAGESCQLAPAVAGAGADGFVVAWQEGVGGASGPARLGFARVGRSGRMTGQTFLGGAGTRERPAVAHAGGAKVALLTWQESDGGEYQVHAAAVRDAGGDMVRGRPIAPGQANQIQPAVASDGQGFLVAWSELVERAENGPTYALKARRLDKDGRAVGDVIDVAARGNQSAVAFDGRQYVVAYDKGDAVWAQRVAADGQLVGDAIKVGGLMQSRPSIATDGTRVAVCAGRIPHPNPWGWHGPSCFSIGRVERDGATPDQPKVGYVELADGGFFGLLDVAKWKGRPGWPASWRGDFIATENGYWPHRYSALTWDGKNWLAVFVRARMDGLSLVDHDLFGCRVDPATMMPTSEPARLAGGAAEPGSQSAPALASLRDGAALLAHQTIDADGVSRIGVRFVAGGSVKGPARVEPGKGNEGP